ncbi:alpha/beta fold hydrolase [Tomitella biformata]|uniref:alpha/beta fold hydrolase n=1 Tax=Tomitella biformata TaxID=630403 RepID=UPI00046469D0|nr:alpha/beta hydrolase [Tomitella biformata]
MDNRSQEFDRLGVSDWGGSGPPILLLHGLMGRGRAWAPHVDWLREYGRVFTLDAAWHRGREVTEAPDAQNMRTERFVADAADALEAIGSGPAIVIGHSMGGLHAWCLAAARPDLVAAIVVEDMAPDFQGQTTQPWDAWFDSWPVEFTDKSQVMGMFGEVAGNYFLDSFDRTDAGWRLHGEIVHWREVAQHWGTRDYWAQWAAVSAPALLIEAEFSLAPAGQIQRMAEMPRSGVARHVRVDGAGHLVQADAPEVYRGAVEAFLSEVLG